MGTMVRVRVRGSPYRVVKVGAVGEVVSRERIGTSSEILKVRFDNGVLWLLYPDEVERLDGSPV